MDDEPHPKRRSVSSLSAVPDRPLAAVSDSGKLASAVDVERAYGLAAQPSAPTKHALTTWHLSQSTPALPMDARRSAGGLTGLSIDPVDGGSADSDRAGKGQGGRRQARKVKSFNVVRVAGAEAFMASKQDVAAVGTSGMEEKHSSSSAEPPVAEGKGEERVTEPPDPQPSLRPVVRRKSTFGFLRKLDTRSESPTPPLPVSASSVTLPMSLHDSSTELLPTRLEAAPQLPELEVGRQLSIAFDPETYVMPESPVESRSLVPIMERTISETTTQKPGSIITNRPRSSTGGSGSSSPKFMRLNLRRSNSVSSSASSARAPSAPPKSPAAPLTASQPSSASPALTSTPPRSRRSSAAGNMIGGLMRMARRRSSATSVTRAYSPALSHSPSIFGPDFDESGSSSLRATPSKQLLPIPLLSAKESSSSLSSGNTGRTSGEVTTAATSQSAAAASRTGFSGPRSRSGSLLRSTASLPQSPSKQSLKPEQDESPEHYLVRLREICSPTEIARVLASSSDPLNQAALEAYVSSFEFTDLPIDIAIRKLLMELFLPSETQQIDRVMEAFAKRYHQQNPKLFTNADQPYLLAFAMIMLHTDAFNSANKNKMTKAAFVKNTRSEGISSTLLGYIYDNICFSPFIFVDEMDVNGQRTLGASDSGTSSTFLPSLATKTKVDPYDLISKDLTRNLRAEVDLYIPIKNPYSFTGTVPFFNSSSLHRAFAEAPILRVILPAKLQPSMPAGGKQEILAVGGAVEDTLEAPRSPTAEHISNLKVSKVGLLYRKDFAGVKSNKRGAPSKWREWSVILTGSQLLFFRDPIWGLDLANQILRAGDPGVGQLKNPRDMIFKPDSVLSLLDAVAVFDWTFTERANSFTLVVGGTKQYQLQAPDAGEMNDWIAIINYAASFKTAGVRMRGTLNSHSFAPTSTANIFGSLPDEVASKHASWTSVGATGLAPLSSNGDMLPIQGTTAATKSKLDDWDDDHVFEQFSSSDLRYRPEALTKSILTTRSDIIRNKIVSLEQTVAVDKASLQADLRLARNLAVLTPFRSTTRERIQEMVGPLARRVQNTRMGLCKNVLMREILARDLLAEEREHHRARHTAEEDDVALVRKSSKRISRSMTDVMAPAVPVELHRQIPDGSVSLHDDLLLKLVVEGDEPPATSPALPAMDSQLRTSFSDPSSLTSPAAEQVEDESPVAWRDTKAGKRVSLVRVDLSTPKEWPSTRPALEDVPEPAREGEGEE